MTYFIIGPTQFYDLLVAGGKSHNVWERWAMLYNLGYRGAKLNGFLR